MDKTFQWYAVRCCCTPLKVFGFLRLEAIGPNTTKEQIVKDKFGQAHVVKFMPMQRRTMVSAELEGFTAGNPEALNDLYELNEREIAIYSDDRPIEFWRNLDNFMEAK